MIEIVVIWVLSVATYLIGYHHGKGTDVRAKASDVIKHTKKLFDTSPVGPVKRPDAATITRWNKPATIREAEDEIARTLDDIPELRKAKELYGR